MTMRHIPTYERFQLIEEAASTHPPKDWKVSVPEEGKDGGILEEIPRHLAKRMAEVLRELALRSKDMAISGAVGDIVSGEEMHGGDRYSDSVVLSMGGESLSVWALGRWIRVGAPHSKSPDREAARLAYDRLVRFLETGEDATSQQR